MCLGKCMLEAEEWPHHMQRVTLNWLLGIITTTTDIIYFRSYSDAWVLR
jgi:hypothetical protein